MKRALLALALCAVLGSCKGFSRWADAPADPAVPEGPTHGQEIVDDVSGVLGAIPVAGPFILLVGAAASLLLAGRKKKAPTP